MDKWLNKMSMTQSSAKFVEETETISMSKQTVNKRKCINDEPSTSSIQSKRKKKHSI